MKEGAALTIWSELVAPLRAFLAKRVPAEVDVEDVLQDVFLRIHQKLPELQDHGRVDAWVFQITRNALADTLRKKQRARAAFGTPADEVAVDEVAVVAEQTNDGSAIEVEFIRCLAPMVTRLEEPYRQAIELTDLGGLTQAEAAARLGISVSGMKSRVQRGRDQLRALFVRCCVVEFDRRGGLVDYAARNPAAARCHTCGTGPALTENVSSSCGSKKEDLS